MLEHDDNSKVDSYGKKLLLSVPLVTIGCGESQTLHPEVMSYTHMNTCLGGDGKRTQVSHGVGESIL